MSHATVRATNIPEIVKLICENMHMSESEALDAFYSSSTGKSYAMMKRVYMDNRYYMFTDCFVLK